MLIDAPGAKLVPKSIGTLHADSMRRAVAQSDQQVYRAREALEVEVGPFPRKPEAEEESADDAGGDEAADKDAKDAKDAKDPKAEDGFKEDPGDPKR